MIDTFRAYDLLSQLVKSEVSVTGTTTLTATAFGKMHKCSGTSADYTITLPAVAGNAGRLLGFRFLGVGPFSKTITLKGNSSEVIRGPSGAASNTVSYTYDEAAVLLTDGTDWQILIETRKPTIAAVCNGRLTVVSGTPVPRVDTANSTSVYFTPYLGNQIALLQDGINRPIVYTFSEATFSMTGQPTSRNIDIFGYWTAGALALSAVAWTDDTNRAVPAGNLSMVGGMLVLAADNTKRYLGTVRNSGNPGVNDKGDFRGLWNYFSRRRRHLFTSGTGQHTWGSTTHAWNTNTNIRFQFVLGEVGWDIPVWWYGSIQSASAGQFGNIGVCIDNVNAISLGTTVCRFNSLSTYCGSGVFAYVAQGFHFVQGVEAGDSAGAPTFNDIYVSGEVEG